MTSIPAEKSLDPQALDQLSIDTLRLLAVDAVEKAKAAIPALRWVARPSPTCCFTS